MPDLITAAEVAAADPAFAELSADRQSSLVTAVSRKIERYCRRTFALASYTEYHSGTGTSLLFLKHRPVTAITSVTVNGVAVTNTANDAWTLDGEAGILTRGDGRGDPAFAIPWPIGTRNIVVVLTGGFDPIPDDVKEACLAEIRYLYDTARVSGVFTQERVGDYFYSMNQMSSVDSGGIGSPGAKSLLAPYVQDVIL
jgi:hypothetical protein